LESIVRLEKRFVAVLAAAVAAAVEVGAVAAAAVVEQ
jgi:hypothetical protein